MFDNGESGAARPGQQVREDALISRMKTSAAVGTTTPPASSSSPPPAAAAAAVGDNSGDAFLGRGSPYHPDNQNNRSSIHNNVGGRAQPTATVGSPAAQETGENLRRALRVSESTNTTGYATMQSLGKQRETIQSSLHTVDSTHQQLGESRQVIRDIRFQVYKEWFIKGCVIGALVLLVILIFWVKFIKK